MKNKQYHCSSCNKKIDNQICRKWICQDCKRKKELSYYHNVNKEKANLSARQYYKNNAERLREISRNRGKRRNLELREMALESYGNKCNCCGESQNEFLAIDHINGGGSKHRKAINKNICLYLFQEKYPKGFRVLCHNCNQSFGYYGYCPHRSNQMHNG